MRNFTNLFKMKYYPVLDVIMIGNSKFIFTSLLNMKKVKPLLRYANLKNYIVFIVDIISDIYMFDEEIFNLSDGFIIFLK